ncbi:putative DNA-binding pseudobarrel domain superfamily [Helianthus anomalus]
MSKVLLLCMHIFHSQPEGLPLKIRDVKGKYWLYQFRFWSNINSRMYVLEGVTLCIQSMQLQLAIPIYVHGDIQLNGT